MPVEIRASRPGDGAGMARVWLSAGAYYAGLDPAHFQVPAADGLAESFEDSITAAARAADEDALELVADTGGIVAGWITARIQHPSASAARQLVREHSWTRLLVNALVVDQELWRQGIGTALLEAAEAWGRARGAEIAQLDTYIGSTVSVPFYERHMGYQRRSILFQKPLS